MTPASSAYDFLPPCDVGDLDAAHNAYWKLQQLMAVEEDVSAVPALYDLTVGAGSADLSVAWANESDCIWVMIQPDPGVDVFVKLRHSLDGSSADCDASTGMRCPGGEATPIVVPAWATLMDASGSGTGKFRRWISQQPLRSG